ncbi:glycosyltransferase family 39 protein [Novosphingobium sp. ES2-1]|uniref:glycosyltransferase family 39 protein n=1 Tax=Novosphingobium sp. ES2-1 TaxID=2780074 RepID=UPI0018813A51|nr:glycosyltransferase family 39 protein [Novosphingobium sp. ES2-1]QOV94996.1 glycosyltransferase family 39 protein [Novosphingobium sp. ES2-1]
MAGGAGTSGETRQRRIDPALAWLLVLALFFRIPISLFTVYHHADEIWQYIEPAYGLITGDWIRTWDIRLGIRSWLIPLVMVGPVWLGHALDPAGELHLVLQRLCMAVASLGTVWAGWSLGARISRTHAITAGFVAAVWVDFAYFASRTSSDTFSVLAILPGLALLVRFRDQGNRRDALIGGFLLGLGFIMRFPLGPALAIPFLWAGRFELRRAWLPLLVGATGGVLCDVLANLAMGEMPLVWIYNNVFANVVANRSHAYGVEAPEWYLQVLIWQWQWIAVALVPALLFGARRYPMLVATAAAVIAIHSAIGHKEYRFILLAVLLLIQVAAIGSVDLAQRLAARRKRELGRIGLVLVLGLWLAASVQVAATEPFVINWGVGKAPLRAMRTVRSQPNFCGLATYRIRDVPFVSRAVLNRKGQTLLIEGRQAPRIAAQAQARYNVAVAPAEHMGELPPAYRFVGCMSPKKPLFEQQYCVFRREGPCTEPAGDLDYNAVLVRIDK